MHRVSFSDPRKPIRPPSLCDRPLLATDSCLERLSAPGNYQSASGFRLRVVSYNLLADMYLKTGRESYDHCPKECLSWEYRKQNILKELQAYKADVLCLQEVQSDHFYSFFEPELEKLGFAAVYQDRRSQLYNGECHVSDGCATFYRPEKFKLVNSYLIEYAKIAEKIPENDRRNRMRKDSLAIVVILEEKRPGGSTFCVANTHLSSGKSLSDVRLFQAEALLKGLEKIESLGFPVLVCGDMNSEPNTEVIRRFLRQDSMNLGSAYADAPEEHNDETLDYIMYSKKNLELDFVLEFPVYESKGKMRQLPIREWSSDHIALVADFRIMSEENPWEEAPNWRDIPRNPWDGEEMKKVQRRLKKLPEMMMIGQPYHPMMMASQHLPWAPAYAIRPAHFIPAFVPQMLY